MTNPVVKLLLIDGRPTVRGECDLATGSEIEAWLDSFDTAILEVDLSGVTFIDSSGLKAFLNVRKRNANLRIVEPSVAVLRLLEITGTHGFLVDGIGIDC
jgi:anti-anti-sigma factor